MRIYIDVFLWLMVACALWPPLFQHRTGPYEPYTGWQLYVAVGVLLMNLIAASGYTYLEHWK